jgi:hypothetical protein
LHQATHIAIVDRGLRLICIDAFGRSDEVTHKGKELCAQGLANAIASLFGGLPGAQATIRSVLILKEGGTMRLAGTAAGVFVMVEMLIFQSFVKLIPQAVFTGVLFKVGYDVFDFEPFIIYVKQFIETQVDARRTNDVLKKRYLSAIVDQEYDSAWAGVWAGDKQQEGQSAYKSRDHLQDKVKRYEQVLSARGCIVASWDPQERARLEAEVRDQRKAREETMSPSARKLKEVCRSVKSVGVAAADDLVDDTKDLPSVGHLEMFIIMGTTAVTVSVNLNAAVLSFTLLFHLLKARYGDAVRDLSSEQTTQATQKNDMAWAAVGLDGGNFTTDRARGSSGLYDGDEGGDPSW